MNSAIRITAVGIDSEWQNGGRSTGASTACPKPIWWLHDGEILFKQIARSNPWSLTRQAAAVAMKRRFLPRLNAFSAARPRPHLALSPSRPYNPWMITPKDFDRLVPAGDTHERDVCRTCGFVNYQNPRIVVGSVVRHEGKVLLCRRAIEPRRGFWTVPAGYLELNETPEDGARREAREEALAYLKLGELLAIYSVPHLSQVQLIWRAELIDPGAGKALFGVGEESLEVALFDWDKLPMEEIAFPTVHWMLGHEREVQTNGYGGPFKNPDQG